MWTPNGNLLTTGPGMYKLPGFKDIPISFNVALLRNAPNTRAVYSSKAVGEVFVCCCLLFVTTIIIIIIIIIVVVIVVVVVVVVVCSWHTALR